MHSRLRKKRQRPIEQRPAARRLCGQRVVVYVQDCSGLVFKIETELELAARDGVKQVLGVLLLRMQEHLVGGVVLYKLAMLHHDHVVGDLTHHGEIVRDEQVGEPLLGLQVVEQMQAKQGLTYLFNDLQAKQGLTYLACRSLSRCST